MAVASTGSTGSGELLFRHVSLLAFDNPVPTIANVSPTGGVAGGAGFTLTVNGSSYINSSVVRWNGSDRVTTFVSPSQITAAITQADIGSAGSANVTVFNPTPGGGESSAVSFTINNPGPPKLEFTNASFSISEGGGSALITVRRSGDTTGTATVAFGISDPIDAVSCGAISGHAGQNCDYTIAAGTISFAVGDTEKSFTIPIIDDAYMEGNETLHLKLENATGATLGANNTAILTILDDDTTPPTTNPIDQAQFFVRQHYLDFLSREPDPGGLDYWSSQITQCGSDEVCIHRHRNGVSGAFFVELEFQRTGSVVYRIHKASYGTRPSYGQFMPDRSQLVRWSAATSDHLGLR